MIQVRFFLLITTFMLAGCMPSRKSLNEYSDMLNNQKTKKIYIAKHGWHTSVILKRASLDTLFPALAMHHTQSYFLDISWGDKKYFMAPGDNVFLAARAALVPTQSVVRVIGFPEGLKQSFSQKNLQYIKITEDHYMQLVDNIKQNLTLDKNGEPIPVEKNTGFYFADKKYWGFRTCNTWIAKAIKKAGFPIKPAFSLTSDNVMKQISSKQL